MNGDLDFVILGGYWVNRFRRMHIRDMDGLVVCAPDQRRRRRGFEPWFPRLSRGRRQGHPPPLQQPAPPSVPPVDGWSVSSSYFTLMPRRHIFTLVPCITPKNPQHHTRSSALCQPTAGASSRHILLRLGGGVRTSDSKAPSGSFTATLRRPRTPTLALEPRVLAGRRHGFSQALQQEDDTGTMRTVVYLWSREEAVNQCASA